MVRKGNLVHRACSTSIQIWFSDDLEDRRAIILIKGPAHNHPTPAPTKLTRAARKFYNDVIAESGITAGLTVAKVDASTF